MATTVLTTCKGRCCRTSEKLVLDSLNHARSSITKTIPQTYSAFRNSVYFCAKITQRICTIVRIV